MQIKSLLIISTFLMSLFTSTLSNAQVILPSGFNEVLVAPGITGPTTMSMSPDGRFFIAQQNGLLRVVKNDTLLAQPFIALNVNIDGERGLLGVVCDPNFAVNQYIYLCYSVPNGAFNRVSRFTASGDTVVPGSEVVVIDLDTLIANYHGGGHLDFGPDGKLYIAAGENGRPLLSQNLDSYLGKILRINSDGTVPTDNPFPGPAKRQRVGAYGLRNPFTFSFQPNTGRMFLNDVGEITWEEINDATVGGHNFGWPSAEGFSTDTAFENPYFDYIHGTLAGQGCAITGGAFFNPSTTDYPVAYQDKYYYIDYCGNWIDMITLNGSPVRSNFASNIANYAVGLLAGIDGNLYYLSRNNEALYKIAYSNVSTPIVVNQPLSQTISVGFPVTFTVTASGASPLSYQWRKGTVDILGETATSFTIPSVAFSDSGNYNVVVTNSFGDTTSLDAHLTVIADQPPQGVINLPAPNSFYRAGDVISFDGTASDPEDGVLPDSMFNWVVEFHHDTHVHPGPLAGSGIHSGTFTIPNTGETSTIVYYRLYLIVHDSNGLIDSTHVDLFPRLSTFTLNTQPQGLSIDLDGQPHLTPYIVSSIEGMYRTINAPYTQNLGQTPVYFTNWNNGGTQSQTFTTPLNDTAWTAIYDSLQLAYSLGPDTLICTTDTFVLDAGSNYTTFAWTDGSVNELLSLHSSVADTIAIGVTVTDANGLTGNDSINVIFDICSGVGTNQIEGISIYPVPSTGDVTISSLKENYLLRVVDMTGKIIIQDELVSANHTRKLHLQVGIYSIILTTPDHRLLYRKNVAVLD
ncbi:MAG: PQQ-dependent sugar dehydrogenase [Bacteroidetes bacterium]|nr:PQQ-dependent sugar dehydrogenase [Bacteroidota bacterium]